MFNKHLRESPIGIQLVILLMLLGMGILIFSLLGAAIAGSVPGASVDSLQNLTVNSTANERIAFFLAQGIASAGLFIVPAVVFVLKVHPRPKEYLNLRPAQKPSQTLWVVLVAIFSIPVVSGIASLIDMIPLSEGLEASKSSFQESQKAYMNMQTTGEFVTAFIVMSIIAAVGEELTFRGLLMRFFAKRSKGKIFWPIFLSSIIFSVIHGNVVGLVSIVIAGMVLGYIYYYTGSLLLSMLAHFIVNGTQITVSYLGRNNEDITAVMESNDMPWPIFIGGCILFIFSFYKLSQSKTPLPNNWTNDFSDAELAAIEAEKQQELNPNTEATD